jgi:superfamily I DNA/RNA helicase
MNWRDGLSGTHLAIAQSTADRLRVMAGPGTGKSFAMKRRIARLVEEMRVDPSRILAVTFTRTAAADLKNELHSLGIPNCEKIEAGTLHAFCFKLLMQQEVFATLGRVPRGALTLLKSKVYQFELAPMLEDIQPLGAFGHKRDMSKRVLAFEAAWSRLQHDSPGWPVGLIDQQFNGALREWLMFHEGMLVGELIPEALRFVRNNPASPALGRYTDIVVDEYQDLNRAEQELIDLLARSKSLSIVGDIDQSIYRFRHANPEGIEDFSTRHPGTEDWDLDVCRRCRQEIVEVADAVIKHNYDATVDHRLLPLLPPDGAATIRVLQWPSLQEEAAGVAQFIAHLIQTDAAKPGDILVLSPRRLIASAIKQELGAIGQGIEVRSFYNDKLMEPVEVQKSLTLLQILTNQEDRLALRFWLGHGSANYLRVEYARLRAYCESEKLSPFQALLGVRSRHIEIPRVPKLTARFGELVAEIDRLRQLEVNEVLNDLFPRGSAWADPIRELLTGKTGNLGSPSQLLDLIRGELTQPETPAGGDFVRIMSLHKSKGLTSRIVIVVGCIHSLIPYVDDDIEPGDIPENIAEQRRLFYVALTRAKEVLVLSSFTTLPRALAYKLGAKIGRHGSTIASQFMDELGPRAGTAIHGDDWIRNGFA